VITLSYGFEKPQDGDPGSTFWDSLELDIQMLNDHTHDGANSAKLSSSSVIATKQNISSGSWAAFGTGYRQLVTMPGALQYDDYLIIFKLNASPYQQMLLTTEKVSSNTYYVYCNDNTVNITAYYLS
jgi:hypothetical protein